MNPGDSSLVTGFSAGKVAVFPCEGTNIATGVGQVIGGGGDVNAAVQGIRSAIAQTPGRPVSKYLYVQRRSADARIGMGKSVVSRARQNRKYNLLDSWKLHRGILVRRHLT